MSEETAEKQYLDLEGLKFVADNIKTRLKAVTEMPEKADSGVVRLFIGETTASYTKAHIYQNTAGKDADKAVWTDITALSDVPTAILPKGTVMFSELPALKDTEVGWMYNISDNFTTTSDFMIPNVQEKVGSNVYCIETTGDDGKPAKKWDVFATPKNIVVDQSYDKESTNALSGVAASKALSSRLEKVAEMPADPSDGDLVIFAAESAGDYVKGHIYEAEVEKRINWSAKTWSGVAKPDGKYIWADGKTFYYSNGSNQYYFDGTAWKSKSWGNLTQPDGRYVWSDGNNIYYSNGSQQYVLNSSNWKEKTWSGVSPTGLYIWKDGENIYCNDYILTKETSTWTKVAWKGSLTSVDGRYVWSDGDNIYYSNGETILYTLDISTKTWTAMSYSTNIKSYGMYIWTDGKNIYYSSSSNHYILNKDKSQWSKCPWLPTTWKPSINFFGDTVWTDGTNIYCSASNDNTNYTLDPTAAPVWTDLTAASNPTKAIPQDVLTSMLD